MTTLHDLLAQARALRDAGLLSTRPTREEAIDWAYGNEVLSNPDVTRDMVERAYDALKAAGALRNVGER